MHIGLLRRACRAANVGLIVRDRTPSRTVAHPDRTRERRRAPKVARTPVMAEQSTTRSDLPAIRAVIDAIIKAVRTTDVEAFLRHAAPDIVVFDMLAPLEQKGWDAVRRSWRVALGPFEGVIEYDVDHLDV